MSDPLKDLDEEDQFEARLRDNATLTPRQKKRRLATLNAKALRGHTPEFDNWGDGKPEPTFNYRDPDGGNVLPSERFFGKRTGET
jgi:hypothetical protein